MAVLPAPPAPTHELGGARFTSLATPSRGSSDTSVWLVEIAPGTAPTPHRLTREEVFIVLAGRAQVHLDGEGSLADVGDAIVVPATVQFALPAVGRALVTWRRSGPSWSAAGTPCSAKAGWSACVPTWAPPCGPRTAVCCPTFGPSTSRPDRSLTLSRRRRPRRRPGSAHRAHTT